MDTLHFASHKSPDTLWQHDLHVKGFALISLNMDKMVQKTLQCQNSIFLIL